MHQEFIGYVGIGFAVIAYIPQIAHLWRFRCAWGISLWSWVLWLVASLFFLAYAILKNDTVFIVVQIFSIVFMLATLVLYVKSSAACPHHPSGRNP